MATSGVFNATNLLLKLSSDGGSTFTNLGHTTSSSISFTLDTPESTSKDSGGYREVIAGTRSIEISFDGLVAYDDTFGAEQVVNLLNNRTKIQAKFGTASTGDPVYTVEGFISSMEVSSEMESPASYSGTFIATGNVTIAT